MLKLAAKSWVAKLMSALFNFGAIIIVSQYLGPADRGICALYGVIVTASLVVNDFAGGPTVVYLMKHCRWVAMRRIYWLWAAVGSGVVSLLFVWWEKISWVEFAWLWPICWLSAAVIFQQQVMMGLQKFGWFNILSVCSAACICLLQWILLSIGWLSTKVYLLSLGLVWLIVFFVGAWLLRPYKYSELPAPGWTQMVKQMFSKGGVNQLVHVAGLLNNRMIYALVAAASLGAFSNALALAEAMLLLPGSLGQVYYASMVGKSHSAAGVRAFKRMLKVNIALLCLGWLLVLSLPASLYEWLFGPGFSEVKPMLVVVAAGVAFYGIYLLTSYWQSAAGKFRQNLVVVCLGLLSNLIILGVLYFTNHFNVISITYSLSVSFAIIGIASFIQFLQQSRHAEVNSA